MTTTALKSELELEAELRRDDEDTWPQKKKKDLYK